MEKQKKTIPKRLIIDISKELHSTVKMRSLKKGLTLREWVLLAIAEKINREMIDEI